MTLRQAEQAAGVPLVVESFEPFEGLCYYANPAGFEGLGFMVGAPDGVRPEDPLDGIILRAEARGGPWQTLSGIRVGSTAAEVAEAYGPRIETEPHAYQEGGQYLTLTGTEADADYGVRFETTPELVVEDIFSGDARSITAIEGCA